jgi:hypothetical protein
VDKPVYCRGCGIRIGPGEDPGKTGQCTLCRDDGG